MVAISTSALINLLPSLAALAGVWTAIENVPVSLLNSSLVFRPLLLDKDEEVSHRLIKF